MGRRPSSGRMKLLILTALIGVAYSVVLKADAAAAGECASMNTVAALTSNLLSFSDRLRTLELRCNCAASTPCSASGAHIHTPDEQHKLLNDFAGDYRVIKHSPASVTPGLDDTTMRFQAINESHFMLTFIKNDDELDREIAFSDSSAFKMIDERTFELITKSGVNRFVFVNGYLIQNYKSSTTNTTYNVIWEQFLPLEDISELMEAFAEPWREIYPNTGNPSSLKFNKVNETFYRISYQRGFEASVAVDVYFDGPDANAKFLNESSIEIRTPEGKTIYTFDEHQDQVTRTYTENAFYHSISVFGLNSKPAPKVPEFLKDLDEPWIEQSPKNSTSHLLNIVKLNDTAYRFNFKTDADAPTFEIMVFKGPNANAKMLNLTSIELKSNLGHIVYTFQQQKVIRTFIKDGATHSVHVFRKRSVETTTTIESSRTRTTVGRGTEPTTIVNEPASASTTVKRATKSTTAATEQPSSSTIDSGASKLTTTVNEPASTSTTTKRTTESTTSATEPPSITTIVTEPQSTTTTTKRTTESTTTVKELPSTSTTVNRVAEPTMTISEQQSTTPTTKRSTEHATTGTEAPRTSTTTIRTTESQPVKAPEEVMKDLSHIWREVPSNRSDLVDKLDITKVTENFFRFSYHRGREHSSHDVIFAGNGKNGKVLNSTSIEAATFYNRLKGTVTYTVFEDHLIRTYTDENTAPTVLIFYKHPSNAKRSASSTETPSTSTTAQQTNKPVSKLDELMKDLSQTWRDVPSNPSDPVNKSNISKINETAYRFVYEHGAEKSSYDVIFSGEGKNGRVLNSTSVEITTSEGAVIYTVYNKQLIRTRTYTEDRNVLSITILDKISSSKKSTTTTTVNPSTTATAGQTKKAVPKPEELMKDLSQSWSEVPSNPSDPVNKLDISKINETAYRFVDQYGAEKSSYDVIFTGEGKNGRVLNSTSVEITTNTSVIIYTFYEEQLIRTYIEDTVTTATIFRKTSTISNYITIVKEPSRRPIDAKFLRPFTDSWKQIQKNHQLYGNPENITLIENETTLSIVTQNGNQEEETTYPFAEENDAIRIVNDSAFEIQTESGDWIVYTLQGDTIYQTINAREVGILKRQIEESIISSSSSTTPKPATSTSQPIDYAKFLAGFLGRWNQIYEKSHDFGGYELIENPNRTVLVIRKKASSGQLSKDFTFTLDGGHVRIINETAFELIYSETSRLTYALGADGKLYQTRNGKLKGILERGRKEVKRAVITTFTTTMTAEQLLKSFVGYWNHTENTQNKPLNLQMNITSKTPIQLKIVASNGEKTIGFLNDSLFRLDDFTIEILTEDHGWQNFTLVYPTGDQLIVADGTANFTFVRQNIASPSTTSDATSATIQRSVRSSNGVATASICESASSPLSFYVLIDSSGSIGSGNWKTVIDFVNMFPRHLNQTTTTVNFIQFANEIRKTGTVEPTWSVGEFRRAAPRATTTHYERLGTGTNTPGALGMTLQLLKKDTNDNNIVIVLTDGDPLGYDTQYDCKDLTGNNKAENVDVTAKCADRVREVENTAVQFVGYGQAINKENLQKISNGRYSTVENFSDLRDEMMTAIMSETCKQLQSVTKKRI